MNETMQQARDAAIDALKPSARDLEHGLKLHAESVVVDSYGFSPTSSIDGDVLKAAIEAGASAVELQDIKEETMMTRHIHDERQRADYVEAWEASGVTCIYQNAGEEGNSIERLIKRLARFTFVTDMLSDFITKAVTPDDIVAAKKAGRRCLYLTGNGVPMPQDWVSLEEELRYIRVFFQLGIRMMHLTYNRRNAIGDGCMEAANAGLSDFGRAVVAEMNHVGVTVDVAHTGWQSSFEAAKASVKPMVASHSCSCAVNNHRRGKPDEVIKAICDTGGYIGICCVPSFLGGDINAFIDHIDHVAKTFGSQHVSIGTDTATRSPSWSAKSAKLPQTGPSRKGWEGFWLRDEPMYTERWIKAERERQTLAWTNWPLFTVGLVQRGYSDDDIRKIIGGNVIRVARDVLS